LEKSRLDPPRSCDGEPAPERVLPAILPAFKAPRNGDRCDEGGFEEVEGSVGEVLAVEEPERGRPTEGGRKPSEGGSTRDDDIIDYPVIEDDAMDGREEDDRHPERECVCVGVLWECYESIVGVRE
jgi:hypothetical protein